MTAYQRIDFLPLALVSSLRWIWPFTPHNGRLENLYPLQIETTKGNNGTDGKSSGKSPKPQVEPLAHNNKGLSISVFGSVARGEETAQSDSDFLVEFEKGRSLFDLIHLRKE